MAKRPPRTVLELAVARAGFVKGGRLAEYVVMWAIASRELDRAISVEDFADWWGKGMSRRNAYYRMTDFRRAFPEFESPQLLADVINRQVAERDTRQLASAPLDLGPALAAR